VGGNLTEDAYHLDRVRLAEENGLVRLTTPFGAGRLTWAHAPERWCRYCGEKGHVWRSLGEDYYHDETTACTHCLRIDCCYREP